MVVTPGDIGAVSCVAASAAVKISSERPAKGPWQTCSQGSGPSGTLHSGRDINCAALSTV